MQLYTKYFDDEDEEQRFNLGAMSRFAGQPEPSYDGGAPPEPEQPMPDMEGLATAQRNNPAQLGTGNGGYPDPRMLEDDAIRAVRDSYGKKRGFFEDAAPAAIALGLDALLNKSRGAGAIVGGYAQGVQRRDMDDQNSMRQMAQLEIQRAREAQADQWHQQSNALGLRNADLREGELAEMRARRLKEGAGLNALQQAQANLAEAKAYQAWSGTDPENELAQARLEETKANNLRVNEDRDAQRQAMIEARRDAAADRSLRRDALEFQKGEAAKLAREKLDDQQREQFVDNTKSQRGEVGRAMQTDEILSRAEKDEKGNYKDIPGIGKWDSIKGDIPLIGSLLQSKDDIAMRGSLTDMADLILRERSGAAAPDPEVQRLAKNVAAGKGITEKEFLVLKSGYDAILKESLKQNAAGRERVARQVMGPEASDWAGIQAPPPAAPQGGSIIESSREEGPATGSWGSNVQEDLGTTGQKRSELPRIDDYLKRLQQNTRTPGVRYRP